MAGLKSRDTNAHATEGFKGWTKRPKLGAERGQGSAPGCAHDWAGAASRLSAHQDVVRALHVRHPVADGLGGGVLEGGGASCVKSHGTVREAVRERSDQATQQIRDDAHMSQGGLRRRAASCGRRSAFASRCPGGTLTGSASTAKSKSVGARRWRRPVCDRKYIPKYVRAERSGHIGRGNSFMSSVIEAVEEGAQGARWHPCR